MYLYLESGEIMIVKLKTLVTSFLPPILTALLAFFSVKSGFSLYEKLNLPPLSPPPVVFRWVWTVLYILLGVTAYLLKECKSDIADRALKIYYLALFVNLLWPIVFFRLQMFTLALIILIILWVLVFIYTMLSTFCKGRIWWLSVPYLLWLSYAAYLNMGIVCLN